MSDGPECFIENWLDIGHDPAGNCECPMCTKAPDPTKDPVSARLNLIIKKDFLEVATTDDNGNILEELDVVHAHNVEALRKKLHELVDLHIGGYIDFLHGN